MQGYDNHDQFSAQRLAAFTPSGAIRTWIWSVSHSSVFHCTVVSNRSRSRTVTAYSPSVPTGYLDRPEVPLSMVVVRSMTVPPSRF